MLEWLSRNKRVTWTFVAQNAQVVDYDGHRVLLAISTVGLTDTFRRGAHADYVRQALIDVLGVDARVDGVPADDAGAAGHPAPPSSFPSGSASGGSGPVSGGSGPAPGSPAFSSGTTDTAPDAGPDARGARGTSGGGAGPASPAHGSATGPSGAAGAGGRTREPASWSDAPPPPDTAPSWASPLEQARATVAVEAEVVAAERVVDDTAISDDDESIDDLTDVGVPVVERILGGTVIAEDPK